ncbi:hypothetical protein LXL04_015472 [Taraxacum kok-saghyz]
MKSQKCPVGILASISDARMDAWESDVASHSELRHFNILTMQVASQDDGLDDSASNLFFQCILTMLEGLLDVQLKCIGGRIDPMLVQQEHDSIPQDPKSLQNRHIIVTWPPNRNCCCSLLPPKLSYILLQQCLIHPSTFCDPSFYNPILRGGPKHVQDVQGNRAYQVLGAQKIYYI